MAFTAPMTFTAGAILTAAQMNTYLRDNMKAAVGADKAACRVYNSAAISVGSGSNTSITFDSERFDIQGMHSTASNTDRITIPTGWGGHYLFGATCRFAAQTGGGRVLRFQINGSGIALVTTSKTALGTGIGQTDLAVASLWAFTAGDYIVMFVYQDSGASLNLDAAPDTSAEAWAIWQGSG